MSYNEKQVAVGSALGKQVESILQAIKQMQMKLEQGRVLGQAAPATLATASTGDQSDFRKQIGKLCSDMKATNAAVAVLSKQVIGLRRGTSNALNNSDLKGSSLAGPRNSSDLIIKTQEREIPLNEEQD